MISVYTRVMPSIKDQPERLRPRERVQDSGVQLLKTEELLTLLLGSGTRRIPVQTLARKIEAKFQAQRRLTLSELTSIKGIGLAKACQILAAIELVERWLPRGNLEVIDTLEKLLQHLSPLRWSQKEQVMAVYLDARLRLVHQEILAVGSMNQAMILPRDIFAPVKSLPVVQFLLAHNHPSGDPTPSAEDMVFTRRIKEAGELMGIQLLDHVIVTQSRHFSFREGGNW